jgi:hypothetical protein
MYRSTWSSSHPPPLAHRGGEDGGHRIARPVAGPVIELIDGAAGPERFLKPIRQAIEPAQADQLFKDDRPTPDRGEEEQDHHRLDHPVGIQKQRPRGKTMGRGGGAAKGQGFNGLAFHLVNFGPYLFRSGRRRRPR